MTDTEPEARRMTVGEIGLMREVIAWRKANDVDFFLNARRPFQGVMQGWAGWSGRPVRNEEGRVVRAEVTWERDRPAVAEVADYHAEPFRWHEVESVTQAADVLVAYGYLPPRFSTAYRAGWDARASYLSSGDDLTPEALVRLGAPLRDLPVMESPR